MISRVFFAGLPGSNVTGSTVVFSRDWNLRRFDSLFFFKKNAGAGFRSRTTRIWSWAAWNDSKSSSLRSRASAAIKSLRDINTASNQALTYRYTFHIKVFNDPLDYFVGRYFVFKVFLEFLEHLCPRVGRKRIRWFCKDQKRGCNVLCRGRIGCYSPWNINFDSEILDLLSNFLSSFDIFVDGLIWGKVFVVQISIRFRILQLRVIQKLFNAK